MAVAIGNFRSDSLFSDAKVPKVFQLLSCYILKQNNCNYNFPDTLISVFIFGSQTVHIIDVQIPKDQRKAQLHVNSPNRQSAIISVDLDFTRELIFSKLKYQSCQK